MSETRLDRGVPNAITVSATCSADGQACTDCCTYGRTDGSTYVYAHDRTTEHANAVRSGISDAVRTRESNTVGVDPCNFRDQFDF